MQQLTVDGVTYTGKAFGTDGLAINIASAYTTVPGGRGVLGVQRSKFSTYDFTFTTDANANAGKGDTHLLTKNGRRASCVFNDGINMFTFEAILTVALTFDIPADRQTFSLQLAIDGRPT